MKVLGYKRVHHPYNILIVVVATYLTTGRRRKIKDASSKKENEWGRHQRLLEKNVRKTKKRSANFEKKGSRVVYT